MTPPSLAKDILPPAGLTSEEARQRLEKFGPNAVPDTALHPLRRALIKFWAPVPWMLEAGDRARDRPRQVRRGCDHRGSPGLQCRPRVLPGRARSSDARRAEIAARSERCRSAAIMSGRPFPLPELVPGDIVKLSLGAVVAADVRLTEGAILLDQSMLTGESIPIEAGPGIQTYAGALVRRGEAVAEVTATGARTKFGRTAELVRTAHVESSQQKAVLRVVRNLAIFNGVVIVDAGRLCPLALKLPLGEIVPLVLTAVLASIPVALPATFTLAAAIGARTLAHRESFRLGSPPWMKRQASMCLCADKTGTLTRNELKVTAVTPDARL